MTLGEFKADEALVKSWRFTLNNDQTVKHAIEALINDSPLNSDFKAATDTEALIRYGEVQGYERAIKNLFDLGELTKMPEQLRRTYSPPVQHG